MEKNNRVTLVYHGVVYSKKNSKRIIRNRQTGRMALVPSEVAQANERDMAEQFKVQTHGSINYPCRIEVVIYEPNHTRRDLDNQVTSILDALKASGAIEDDDWKHIAGVSITLGGVDKNDPRAEVTLVEVEETKEFKVEELKK